MESAAAPAASAASRPSRTVPVAVQGREGGQRGAGGNEECRLTRDQSMERAASRQRPLSCVRPVLVSAARGPSPLCFPSPFPPLPLFPPPPLPPPHPPHAHTALLFHPSHPLAPLFPARADTRMALLPPQSNGRKPTLAASHLERLGQATHAALERTQVLLACKLGGVELHGRVGTWAARGGGAARALRRCRPDPVRRLHGASDSTCGFGGRTPLPRIALARARHCPKEQILACRPGPGARPGPCDEGLPTDPTGSWTARCRPGPPEGPPGRIGSWSPRPPVDRRRGSRAGPPAPGAPAGARSGRAASAGRPRCRRTPAEPRVLCTSPEQCECARLCMCAWRRHDAPAGCPVSAASKGRAGRGAALHRAPHAPPAVKPWRPTPGCRRHGATEKTHRSRQLASSASSGTFFGSSSRRYASSQALPLAKTNCCMRPRLSAAARSSAHPLSMFPHEWMGGNCQDERDSARLPAGIHSKIAAFAGGDLARGRLSGRFQTPAAALAETPSRMRAPWRRQAPPTWSAVVRQQRRDLPTVQCVSTEMMAGTR